MRVILFFKLHPRSPPPTPSPENVPVVTYARLGAPPSADACGEEDRQKRQSLLYWRGPFFHFMCCLLYPYEAFPLAPLKPHPILLLCNSKMGVFRSTV